jgi:hypothetical protein
VILPCEDDQGSKDELWATGNQPRFTMLQVHKEDVRREWPFSEIQPDPASRKGRVGAKQKYDWQDIEDFVWKKLDSKGDFKHVDTTDDWKSQNDLIAAVTEYIEHHRGDAGSDGPAHSTMKERIAPMVARWRSSRNSAEN